MKLIRTTISFGCLLLIAIFCCITNPTTIDYTSWLKENYVELNLNKVTSNNPNVITDVFSKFAAKALTSYTTTTKDCFLFTIFTTHFNNKSLKVIGIFNHFIPLNTPSLQM